MTKDWNEIKEEACQLYLSGWSLPKIREHLRQERNFEASTRSFREKFKAWGITKAEQLQSLKTQSSTRGTAFSPDNLLSPENGEPIYTFERAQTEPLEVAAMRDRQMSVPASPRTVRQQAPSHKVGKRVRNTARNPRVDSSASPIDVFNDVYEQLQETTRDNDVTTLLKGITFANGQDSVFHSSAGKDDVWVVTCVIKYLQTSNIDIDLLDKNQRTALQVAIERNCKYNVKVILSGGARVSKENIRRQQPLHTAVLEGISTDICRILLQNGADVNAGPETPLSLAWRRLKSASNRQDKEHAAAIVECLLDYGAKIDTALEESTFTSLSFLRQWKDWVKQSKGKQQERGFRLMVYLLSDFNPLCWFPHQCCPSFKCESFGAYILAHTPDTGLTSKLLEVTDMSRHGIDLLEVIVTPCPRRTISTQDDSPVELFGKIVRDLYDLKISVSGNLDLLEKILESSLGDEKADIIDVLQQFGTLAWEKTLIRAWELSSALWLRLSEMVTPNSLADEISESLLLSEPLYSHHTNTETMPISTRYPQATETLSKTLGNMPDLQQKEADIILRSTVHVVTKSILEGRLSNPPMSVQERIPIALKIRRNFELPDIQIGTQYLIGVIPPGYEEDERTPRAHDIHMTDDSEERNHTIE